MPTEDLILVTGATGNTGSALVQRSWLAGGRECPHLIEFQAR